MALTKIGRWLESKGACESRRPYRELTLRRLRAAIRIASVDDLMWVNDRLKAKNRVRPSEPCSCGDKFCLHYYDENRPTLNRLFYKAFMAELRSWRG